MTMRDEKKQENKVKVLAMMQAEVSSDSFTIIQDYCVYLVLVCECSWLCLAGGGGGGNHMGYDHFLTVHMVNACKHAVIVFSWLPQVKSFSRENNSNKIKCTHSACHR